MGQLAGAGVATGIAAAGAVVVDGVVAAGVWAYAIAAKARIKRRRAALRMMIILPVMTAIPSAAAPTLAASVAPVPSKCAAKPLL